MIKAIKTRKDKNGIWVYYSDGSTRYYDLCYFDKEV